MPLFLNCFASFSASADPGAAKYMGVGSCASSNCHGGTSPRQSSNVLQNEYVTWSKHDLHAKAWTALTTPESKKIGMHLGMSAPEKEPWCLSCHGTYSETASQYGPDFRMEDGVSCEACHGAAEHYLSEHASAKTSHARNVQLGMRDLVPLDTRANLCLGCHAGSEKASVTHRLIGAGHPRLSFELDTYSMLQPRHWKVDEDYRKRKADYNSARAWLVGQSELARNYLQTLASEKRSKFGAFPELTTLACYSCHHSLGQEQWKSREYDGRPGELRLNTAALFIVEQALRALKSPEADVLGRQIDELHAAFRDQTLATVAPKVEGTVKTAGKFFLAHALDDASLKLLLKGIAQTGAKVPHLQYEFAEQVTMALSSVLAQLSPDRPLYEPQMKALYAALKTPSEFRAEEFTKAAELLAKQL